MSRDFLVFISGPITGIENYEENFARAEREICSHKNFNVCNPTQIPRTGMGEDPGTVYYESIMEKCIDLLDHCDAIYMLKGWENSIGANREYGYALGKRLPIIKEGEDNF